MKNNSENIPGLRISMSKACYLGSIVLLFSLSGCSKALSQSKKDKHKHHEENYQEDISSYRPKFNAQADTLASNKKKPEIPPVPQNDITKKLNIELDSMAASNPKVKTAPGFRVLVYSGKSSDAVKKVKTQIYELIPDADIKVEFKSPNQIVKVGNCIDRLEAYNLKGKLHKAFPNAVIVPDQVRIIAK